MAVLFGLGGLIYKDRFLARIGWSSAAQDPGFGGVQDTTSVKAKIVNLIASVRTLMRIPLIAINAVIILYELILG
ncbi:hypothetical protein CAC42_5719 [Sphaceloma murrayae]|uniref:Protein transport protein yos1 n=1 Tax=Sphaceloma murrayae TaxID=2082308 RepID=A0A2K1QZ18_9PEZI|nr:hypothetical protein CAC42_5719 [Sphaceloma murrayae]